MTTRARYTVVAPLGRGTRVFRGVAEWSDRKRDVVIVRVLPTPMPPRFVGMLLDDLRPTLALRHANIVELVDIAKTPEGVFFIVTEYVAGSDLKTLVARGDHIAIRDVLRVVVECCNGLAYAHGLDVVHRDVSPRTILLGTHGEVKLGEFGLAKASAQFVSSGAGAARGRFGYISPELARGLNFDCRTDVFAVGIVLWELLAGRRLFLGQTDYQTVELIRDARIPVIESLDPALDAIVRKALARDPAARFQADHGSLARLQEEVSRMISLLDDGERGRWN